MMTRNATILMLALGLAAGWGDRPASAHGFGGGGGFRGGGGGFRPGGFGGGSGGFRGGEMGAMHSGGYAPMGGFRGGYGGMSSFGRTPSYSMPGTFGRAGGEFRGLNPYGGGPGASGRMETAGPYGGRSESGYRAGSYTTGRGTTIDYGAAGRAGVGPGGAAGARGVAGVDVTTPGGRSFADVGRAGGVVGPGGAAVAGRSNVAVASGARGSAGYRPNGFNAYNAYHAGWVHGYWNGHGDTAWGWNNGYWGGWGRGGWGWGMGMGLGYGLSAWGFGSPLYGMGYLPYMNPYYGYGGGATVVVNQPVVASPYDYSQPIDTAAEPAPAEVVDPAVATFDAARDAFKRGNYDQALTQADAALKSLPNDTALHEFRGLCQFALGRYDEAAATLYAVLSVGPGWDWATMVGLYPSVDAYTSQLRALEEYCGAHPTSAPPWFVLGYHYLTEGHVEAAAAVLKQVVALMPNDALSARLLRQLAPPKGPAAAPSASPAPADTTPPAGASIAGTWTARPAADTAVALTIQPAGGFTWQVTRQGQSQPFSGTSTYGGGILTLVQEKGPALVGRVSWKDPDHITFRVVGDGPDDPGLTFARGGPALATPVR